MWAAGTVVLCVFGLPPRPHADDALRAVLASMALRDAMDGRGDEGGGEGGGGEGGGGGGVLACTGVATGRVFCGVVGSAERREFTTMGSVVNLSARLMGLASSGGVIVGGGTSGRLAAARCLCCEATRLQTVDAVSYKQLPQTKLKGTWRRSQAPSAHRSRGAAPCTVHR